MKTLLETPLRVDHARVRHRGNLLVIEVLARECIVVSSDEINFKNTAEDQDATIEFPRDLGLLGGLVVHVKDADADDSER